MQRSKKAEVFVLGLLVYLLLLVLVAGVGAHGICEDGRASPSPSPSAVGEHGLPGQPTDKDVGHQPPPAATQPSADVGAIVGGTLGGLAGVAGVAGLVAGLGYLVIRWVNRAPHGVQTPGFGASPEQGGAFQDNALFEDMVPNPLYSQP